MYESKTPRIKIKYKRHPQPISSFDIGSLDASSGV